jgi:predicted dehydrogenase
MGQVHGWSTGAARCLRVGVSGLGKLGQFHLQKVLTLSKELPLKPTVIYDPQLGALNLAVQKIRDFDSVEMTSTQSFDEALDQLDVLILASPSECHFSQVKLALQRGKHVFVEKPLSLSFFEAKELCELARRENLSLGVGHNERFNPSYLGLKKKMQLNFRAISGELLFRFNRETLYHPRVSGVSVVDDLMIHDLDLFLDFMEDGIWGKAQNEDQKKASKSGLELKLIHAKGRSVISKEIDWADVHFVGLYPESGEKCFVSFFASRVSPQPQRKIFVSTAQASYQADLQKLRLLGLGKMDEALGDFQNLSLDESYESVDSLLVEQRHFFENLLSGQRLVDERAALAVGLGEQIKNMIQGEFR